MRNYEKYKNESNKKLADQGLFSISNPVPITEAIEQNIIVPDSDCKYYELLGIDYAKLDVLF